MEPPWIRWSQSKVKTHLKETPLLDFALAVEQITTKKKAEKMYVKILLGIFVLEYFLLGNMLLNMSWILWSFLNSIWICIYIYIDCFVLVWSEYNGSAYSLEWQENVGYIGYTKFSKLPKHEQWLIKQKNTCNRWEFTFLTSKRLHLWNQLDSQDSDNLGWLKCDKWIESRVKC